MPTRSVSPKLAVPTTLLPAYSPDGSGRDLWRVQHLVRPPRTGTLFPRSRKESPTKKYERDLKGNIPKFVPNGSGRDLFQQCNGDIQICHTGVTGFSSKPPVIPRKGRGVSFLGKSVPKYLPNGSGRDLYLLSDERPLSAISSVRIERVSKAPRSRTSPPPRFRPVGSGRDMFQSSIADEGSQTSSYREFKPNVSGFAYGHSSISSSSNYLQKRNELLHKQRLGIAKSPGEQRSFMQRLSTPVSRKISP